MVAYLCSDAAAEAGITGQTFYVQGGLVQLYQGWTPVSEVQKDERWAPVELAARMEELFGKRPRAYSPSRSPLRMVTGIGARPPEPGGSSGGA
jgi:hypothetical protein